MIGGMFVHSAAELLLFGALKTLADVLMHLVEHARLQGVRPNIGTG